MGIKQRFTRRMKGLVEDQLDWLVELGELAELADGNLGANTLHQRAAEQTLTAGLHSENSDRESANHQSSDLDQKGA